MKAELTPKFSQKLNGLPEKAQGKFYKQLDLLLRDLRYPSLKAKKYDEEFEIWQARVDRGYRFYFLIREDTYVLIDIKSHPK